MVSIYNMIPPNAQHAIAFYIGVNIFVFVEGCISLLLGTYSNLERIIRWITDKKLNVLKIPLFIATAVGYSAYYVLLVQYAQWVVFMHVEGDNKSGDNESESTEEIFDSSNEDGCDKHTDTCGFS